MTDSTTHSQIELVGVPSAKSCEACRRTRTSPSASPGHLIRARPAPWRRRRAADQSSLRCSCPPSRTRRCAFGSSLVAAAEHCQWSDPDHCRLSRIIRSAVVMWVGALEFDLLLGDVHSLKEKRSLVRPLIAEVRKKFELSVAEVDHLDLHRRGGRGGRGGQPGPGPPGRGAGSGGAAGRLPPRDGAAVRTPHRQVGGGLTRQKGTVQSPGFGFDHPSISDRRRSRRPPRRRVATSWPRVVMLPLVNLITGRAGRRRTGPPGRHPAPAGSARAARSRADRRSARRPPARRSCCRRQ